MSKPIIEVHDLSKQYRLGVIGATTLRDSFDRWWQRLRNGHGAQDMEHGAQGMEHGAQSTEHGAGSGDQGQVIRNPTCEITDQKSQIKNGKSALPFNRKSKIKNQKSDPPSLDTRHSSPDFIWALKDVSFEVQPGEVLGIIGRNGAGKSTLLKILSRITEPTSGTAIMRGRVASLLEVGTGFHPELTGRENIYLNGAILGMKRAEIDRKFDEIVAFAEVEKFIDTPVKRYSSGMYVRLAFAVAAHLEPEILLVDEVLAVGDAAFQKKCLGKMGDVAREGRTVLFVSHNMRAIVTLCERAVWLDGGRVVTDDSAIDVTERYLSVGVTHSAEWHRPQSMPSPEEFYFLSARVKNGEGEICSAFESNEPIAVEIEYVAKRHLHDCIVTAELENAQGVLVFDIGDTDSLGVTGTPREPGEYRGEFLVPGQLLSPGLYYVTIGVGNLGRFAYEVFSQVVTLEVLATRCVQPTDKRKPGIISPLIAWHTTRMK